MCILNATAVAVEEAVASADFSRMIHRTVLYSVLLLYLMDNAGYNWDRAALIWLGWLALSRL